MSASFSPGESSQILFLAILLDRSLHEITTRRIASTCRKHGFTGRAISANRLHLSLIGVGRYDQAQAAQVSQLVASIHFPAIEITLDRALSYRNRNPHPFVLTSEEGLTGVKAFYQVLTERFTAHGLPVMGKRSFHPHMTLIWDPKMIPEYELTVPLQWTARDFVLVRSYQGQSRYDIVERWPLTV